MPASLVAATQSLEANTQSKETASPPAQETFLGAVGDDSFENMPIGADRSPLRRPRQPHEPDAFEQARCALLVLCVACDFAESQGRGRQHRPRAGPRD